MHKYWAFFSYLVIFDQRSFAFVLEKQMKTFS